MKEYKVWKTNSFNEVILIELMAIFYDFKKAEDFANQESPKSESYIVIDDGKYIYIV